ncbi:NlpC/P60 family protein [Microbispora sp. NPDC046973]|uniref:C40 family peptidase n=1 Tax=Microbispora sp. NPDC046973 TaxID=3155022 RepID=UPI00340F773A
MGRKPEAPLSHILLRLAGALAAVAGMLMPSVVLAAPKPTPKELKAQLARLNEQAEKLTEQYNGRRVELAAAKRESRRLNTEAARIEQRYAQVREATRALANTSYMNGSLASPSLAMAGGDPRAVLSAASLTAQFSQQWGMQLKDALRLQDQVEQARERANAHKKQLGNLVSDLAGKKQRIEKLIEEVKAKIEQLGPPPVADLPTVSVEGQGKAAEAARWAVSQVGKPYVWGAAGPNSFDCSGLMLWAYSKVGINLPHYTGAQWQLGTRVPSMDQLQVGDIVFFYSDLHHNGMYVGDGMMVHAPQTGDVVKIVSIKTRPFMGGVRLVS